MSPAEQLADELDCIISALVPFTGIDGAQVRTSYVERCVADLAQETDDRLAAEACLSIMTALWPNCAPEDCGRGDWWRTPLGRLCARSLGRDDTTDITHATAAAMLGTPRGSIGTYLHRGDLQRHPDGGVLRASVLRRLGR